MVNTLDSHSSMQGFEPPTGYHIKNKSRNIFLLNFYIWLGYLDSNQGDDRVKVCCLTAWLYPNNRWWRRADSNHRTKGTELQSAAFSHFATPPSWCRLKDLNPQPTDYKSVALPIELSRLNKKMVEVNGLEPLTLCL